MNKKISPINISQTATIWRWLIESGVSVLLPEPDNENIKRPINHIDIDNYHAYKLKNTQDLINKHKIISHKKRVKSNMDNGDSYSLAQKARNLTELEAYINLFEGCLLKKTAKNTVFARGTDKPLIMFIGEAPGNEEDEQGKPFVGQSGKLLDQMIKAAGIDENLIRIANILPWHPPENRTPKAEEIESCLPFCERHIELAAPRILVMLGAVAAKSLLGSSLPIGKLRQDCFSYQPANFSVPIKAKPSFHPSYLLRAPQNKRKAWQDFLEIAEMIDNLS